MSAHGNSRSHAGSTLPELVKQLRRRCNTVAGVPGGYTYYAEELQIFREYASTNGLLLTEAPHQLDTAPSDEGNEHQVWFCSDSSSFLKATWADHFGMLVVHRNDEEPSASPIDYLERWMLHNQLFGDTVSFLGALDTDQGLRLIITQPAIKGTPATDQEINAFFINTGWKKFTINGDIAYFDPKQNVVISDTHSGNIIALKNGLFLPIDLRVQPLTGTLLQTVIQLTQNS
ncbi:MAG: hypothetical protein ACSHX6_04635 [Akkermansiaceae bacterium]